MEQPEYILDNGTRIRTRATLRHSDRFGARHPDTPGKIAGVVGGMGGDVYHVDHDGIGRAVYCFDEFELVTHATRIARAGARLLSALEAAQVTNMARYAPKGTAASRNYDDLMAAMGELAAALDSSKEGE